MKTIRSKISENLSEKSLILYNCFKVLEMKTIKFTKILKIREESLIEGISDSIRVENQTLFIKKSISKFNQNVETQIQANYHKIIFGSKQNLLQDFTDNFNDNNFLCEGKIIIAFGNSGCGKTFLINNIIKNLILTLKQPKDIAKISAIQTKTKKTFKNLITNNKKSLYQQIKNKELKELQQKFSIDINMMNRDEQLKKIRQGDFKNTEQNEKSSRSIVIYHISILKINHSPQNYLIFDLPGQQKINKFSGEDSIITAPRYQIFQNLKAINKGQNFFATAGAWNIVLSNYLKDKKSVNIFLVHLITQQPSKKTFDQKQILLSTIKNICYNFMSLEQQIVIKVRDQTSKGHHIIQKNIKEIEFLKQLLVEKDQLINRQRQQILELTSLNQIFFKIQNYKDKLNIKIVQTYFTGKKIYFFKLAKKYNVSNTLFDEIDEEEFKIIISKKKSQQDNLFFGFITESIEDLKFQLIYFIFYQIGKIRFKVNNEKIYRDHLRLQWNEKASKYRRKNLSKQLSQLNINSYQLRKKISQKYYQIFDKSRIRQVASDQSEMEEKMERRRDDEKENEMKSLFNVSLSYCADSNIYHTATKNVQKADNNVNESTVSSLKNSKDIPLKNPSTNSNLPPSNNPFFTSPLQQEPPSPSSSPLNRRRLFTSQTKPKLINMTSFKPKPVDKILLSKHNYQIVPQGKTQDYDLLIVGKNVQRASVKLLMAILTGKPMVMEDWLREREMKWEDVGGWKMVGMVEGISWEAIDRVKDRTTLFDGVGVFFFSDNVQEYKRVFEAAGGKIKSELNKGETTNIIINCEADQDKQLFNKNKTSENWNFYSHRVIAQSILFSQLQFKEYLVDEKSL